MRKKTFYTVLISLFAISCSSNKVKLNSLQPGEVWPDNNGVHINAHGGGILFYNKTYYWYGEHKVEGTLGNRAQVGVHVYSSKDLYNWKDEGIALKVVENDTLHEIAIGCIMERPKVIYNPDTKKFVMWFHLELKDKGYSTALSGIAIADYPEGPFNFVRSLRPNAGSWPVNVREVHKKPVADSIRDAYCGGPGCLPGHPDTVNILGRDFHKGQMARDMTLFVDDDGAAYHIYSSEENSTTHISRLTDDYLSYSGEYIRIFPGRYMEAPTLFKTIEGKYYFIASGCTGWKPNEARLAMADNIWGPWTELSNPCIGADAELTFQSQSTYVLPVEGRNNAFIFMADRWQPDNAIDGRYIWLPVQFNENNIPYLEWMDKWDLNFFKN